MTHGKYVNVNGLDFGCWAAASSVIRPSVCRIHSSPSCPALRT